MGLTAKEALELSKGNLEHRGFLFKLKLIYLCGLIDQDIRKAANFGETEIAMDKLNSQNYKRYMPSIWSIYEDMGYNLYRTYGSSTTVFINWDPNFKMNKIYRSNVKIYQDP